MSSKARDALVKIGNISAFVKTEFPNTAKYMNDIISIVQATLAKPLRNCDVGTANQQYKRFAKFCSKHSRLCVGCPFKGKGVSCVTLWSKMPYEPVKTNNN